MNDRLHTHPQLDISSAVLLASKRQKPLIGASLLERLLLRHVDHVSAESRLCVAVIKQAFIDLCAASPHLRVEARRFFHDGHLDVWCDRVGLSPDFMREIALKTGYLPAHSTPNTKAGGGHA